jgi:hypothetical protein
LNKGRKNLFNEIIAGKCPNMGKEMHIQIHEEFRIPSRHDQKRNSAHHLTVKMPRVQNKERTLKNCSKEVLSHLPKQTYSITVDL